MSSEIQSVAHKLTMNLIILLENDFISSDKVRLTDRRREHINKIHRAVEGETLKVGLLNGKIGSGLITKLNKDCIEMSVTLTLDSPVPAPLTLILALPRPPTLRKVIQGTIEMGIKKIILIGTRRVEKSFWQSSQLKEDKLFEQQLLGLEQAVDTTMPEILFRQKFKPFIEDEAPALTDVTMALVADAPVDCPCFRHVGHSITLAVGPEGGFIPYEIDLLKANGFQTVHLGERIMRVEHAVFSLISKLL